jgi:hypothetical protein
MELRPLAGRQVHGGEEKERKAEEVIYVAEDCHQGAEEGEEEKEKWCQEEEEEDQEWQKEKKALRIRRRRLKKRNVMMACLVTCQEVMTASKNCFLAIMAICTFVTALLTLLHTYHDPGTPPQDTQDKVNELAKAARGMTKFFKTLLSMGNSTREWIDAAQKMKHVLVGSERPAFDLSEGK